jgi:hypothetical protein
VFREREGVFRNLREYFLAWKGVNPTELRELARRFLDLVMEREAPDGYPGEEMQALFSAQTPEEALAGFGEELTILLRSYLWQSVQQEGAQGQSPPGLSLSDAPSVEQVETWSDMLGRSLNRMKSLNLNPELVLESLYYRMRSVV